MFQVQANRDAFEIMVAYVIMNIIHHPVDSSRPLIVMLFLNRVLPNHWVTSTFKKKLVVAVLWTVILDMCKYAVYLPYSQRTPNIVFWYIEAEWLIYATVPYTVFGETVLAYCQLDSIELISMNFYLKSKRFHYRKCIWKCRLLNGSRFVSALLC